MAKLVELRKASNVHLTLIRKIAANGAVVGELIGLSKRLFVLEDEWRNNEPRRSCIPAATYTAKPHGWEPYSPFKYKQVWQLNRVPNRSGILFHAGNKHEDTEGCLLVGMGMQITQLQSMVTDSRVALELMRLEIGNKEFKLTIVDAWDTVKTLPV